MFGVDPGQGRVGEDVVLPLGEGRPGLVDDAQLGHDGVRGVLLSEGVRLDLVHRRWDLGQGGDVDEALGVEVRDADGA